LEVKKFEAWVEEVRPLLIDPTYKANWEEKRLAVRILGIHAVVSTRFPHDPNDPNGTKGRKRAEFAHDVEVTAAPPKIMEVLQGCSTNHTITFPAN